MRWHPIFPTSILLAALIFSDGVHAPLAAHDLIPGVGGFAGRVLHPFIIIEHFLCLLAAGLIAGAHVGKPIWRSILVLIIGITLGFFLAQTVIPIIGVLWMLPLGAAVLAGLLVALAPRFSAPVWLGIIFALGFSVGLETDPEGVFLIDSIRTVSGLVTAAIIVLVVIGFPLSRTRLDWVKILVRIIGSWITAIAIMVLALNFQ